MVPFQVVMPRAVKPEVRFQHVRLAAVAAPASAVLWIGIALAVYMLG